MIYFTSDSHLFHENIIKYCDRPFDNIDTMNDLIITNLHETLTNKDILFHLGDLTLGGSKNKPTVSKWIKQLPCEKHFIMGNHDRFSKKFYKEECGFKTVQYYICTARFSMTHRPEHFLREEFINNKILLHGHTHFKNQGILFESLIELRDKNIYDVGVDANNFKPVSLSEIKKFFKNKKEEVVSSLQK